MKTLFLLLIIYNLQYYVVHSHDTSTIIYKTFPKKVHPDPEHRELVNAGSYFKKSYKSKTFTRFEPPLMREWTSYQNNEKAGAPRGSLLPVDFQVDLKSKVRKVPYFNDKDTKRSKRAVNETTNKPEITPKESSTVPPTQKTEIPRVESKQTVTAAAKSAPKNSSNSRRFATKNVKAAAKSGTSKRSKPHKVGNDGKAARTGNVKQQGAKKNLNHKRNLRNRKAKSRVARAGKRQTQNVKGGKVDGRQASKLSGRQGKKVSGKKVTKLSGKQGTKLSGRQGTKLPARQGSKPAKQVMKQAGKKAGKSAARRSQTRANPKVRRAASRRLISARDARPEDYPYVISIQKDGAHWCSGAILNPQLIISTANCFWKSKAVSRMKIRAGAQSIDTGGQVAYIAEVRKHPNWSIRKEPQNDIALALLDRNLRFSDAVHAVDLPNIFMKPPFDDAWVTSYGAERRDGIFSRMRLTLQVVHMRLMDGDRCNNITSRFGVILDDSFFCLQQAGRRAPCTRDTGAPAVSDGVLWGLASWGIRKLCGTTRFPAVFSDVSEMSNMDFIVNATKHMMGEQRLDPFHDRPPMRASEDAATGDTSLQGTGA